MLVVLPLGFDPEPTDDESSPDYFGMILSLFIDKLRDPAYLLVHINTEFQTTFTPLERSSD
jgi:hypothetical protein